MLWNPREKFVVRHLLASCDHDMPPAEVPLCSVSAVQWATTPFTVSLVFPAPCIRRKSASLSFLGRFGVFHLSKPLAVKGINACICYLLIEHSAAPVVDSSSDVIVPLKERIVDLTPYLGIHTDTRLTHSIWNDPTDAGSTVEI